jgi:hypothetical protein
MKNKLMVLVLFTLALANSPLANASLVRVSDASDVVDLNAETSTVWHIGEGSLDGLLLGAYNVDVNGTLWDVAFKSGTFVEVFGDETGLDTTEQAMAVAMSQALLDQVFLDGLAYFFDSQPALTFVCEADAECVVWTPYAIVRQNVSTGVAVNFDASSLDFSVAGGIYIFFSLDRGQTNTWADWRLSSSRSVPEPFSAFFIFIGLAGLMMGMRKS